ncbi:PIN/TRAM domain-containing protein [Brevibacillus sp. AY1]|uniref:PIN/TRAM domain-containing protein n=1 Tax=Brevibacillus sp. AY1 TaxID=2807621 RepID=UPI0024576EAC|nr:PIN/TRAM domain-containing protein [Brevibacillus sp. AY1]MDH4618814.1 PIN/TRAM domain-containing protein [Brevibacillus sp. AY1]
MVRRIGKIFFVLVGGGLGYQYGPDLYNLLDPLLNFGVVSGTSYIGAVLGAILFFFLANWLLDYILKVIRWGEETLVKMPIVDVMFGAMGLISGLIVAFLLFLPISKIPIPVIGDLLPLVVSGLLGYLGFQVGFRKRDEIMSVFSIGRKDKKKEAAGTTTNVENKILDTSVIIDGRIADICRTGFLEGSLIIPGFVLEELQHIADSSDVLKRNRGRRGLDILNKIQKEMKVKVQIWEGDFEEVSEVDSKLIKLAKVINGKVVTNDFNLNKVCELQGVPVLNINDLANAVKPVVLPGEEMNVQVIKDGKEHGQGVAYLDDGTMIVVEGGREYIGNDVDVLVTSVLQTSAGRMIFAKPKLLEKAL